MRDIRHVVIHRPGPNWKAGVPIFEQVGLQDHLAHFRQWHAAGRLVMGGPFLDDAAGGMMLTEAGLTEAEVVAFANADPCVASGLLTAEVRPWLVGMKK